MSEMVDKDQGLIENMEDALKFGLKEVRSGELVKGTVVTVRDDEVLLDIGAKTEGTIPIREFSCCDVVLTPDVVKVGDVIEAYVIRVIDSEGKILLSKRKADAAKAWVNLVKSYENGEKVTGVVTEVVKGGVLVDLGVQGFIPASQIDRGYVETLDQYLGMKIEAKIIEMNKEKGKLVLSRKSIIEEDYAKKKEELWSCLQEGQVVKGIVRRLTNFGAFVDIGGCDGLVHISEMSWQRIKHPSEVVKIGDEVEVMVLKLDKNNEKISLGLKQVLPNPWDNVAKKYPVGSEVNGKVVKILNFGAFVEIENGIEGLIHISQLANHRVVKVEDVVTLGQEVKARVIEVKIPEKRISLSLKEQQVEEEKAHVKNEVEEYLENQNEESNVTLGDVFGDAFKEIKE